MIRREIGDMNFEVNVSMTQREIGDTNFEATEFTIQRETGWVRSINNQPKKMPAPNKRFGEIGG